LVAVEYLKKAPKESDLQAIARIVEGGPEVLLRDNSWPRVVNPDEIAAVCAANPVMMQRPLLVAPGGVSAVCRPLSASPKELQQVCVRGQGVGRKWGAI
jgi:arsenate reductase-like glutaredoxin family protein